MWTCAGVLALVVCASALTRDQFYSHGPGLDQSLPKGNEVPSPEHVLRVPIRFYGETYESVFVNNFGVLTFRADLPSFLNIEFPLPYPSIAVFYTNIDTTNQGAVYYRETNEPHILSKAEESVQDNFHDYYDFKPRSVFIATWVSVTYTSNSSLIIPKNSFQIAIISNGTESFVELLYPERDIQWYQKESQIQSLPDAKAQAGFVSEDGRTYELRGSGSHQIRNIVTWSNTHEPGQYVFRVGNIPYDGNIEAPDNYNQNEIEIEEESKTCAQSGPSVCSIDARCLDYSAGICCICKDGYYGNGKSCIKNDVPLRVHGKINGVLNQENLNDVDIQAYVVVGEGRAYTALSLVPHGLGSSLQLLNVLGGVIGWLFAKPSGTAKNGYQLTGSLFNHTADVWFPGTNDRVTINQEYLGHDVFDQITLETDIRGSLPEVASGTKLEMTDYEEQYTLVEPGRLRSQSSRTFINKLTGEKIEQRVSQTFTFSSCRFAPPSELDKLPSTLKVNKNYLGYETRDNIVRYGMTNKIHPLGQKDPCIGNNCGPHSTCVADGDSFACICQSGFTSIYKDNLLVCVDIDECQAGTHNCDGNADCYNHAGGFQCRCRVGFTGNGITCTTIDGCSSKRCDSNAQCVENAEGASCVCNPGYYGDGILCLPTQDQSSNNEADYNDSFVLPNCDNSVCTCPPGYSDFRDNLNNQLCRLNYNAPSQRGLENGYQEPNEPSYQQPSESYYWSQTDRPYPPPTEPPYRRFQPPTEIPYPTPKPESFPGPWNRDEQPEQQNYEQSNYDPNSGNNYPPSNYDPSYNSQPSSNQGPQVNGYDQSPDDERQRHNNNYQHPDDSRYKRPDDRGYQQPDDSNYQQPSGNNYEQPSGNNYEQPSGNNYEQPTGNNYEQPSGNNYQQQPSDSGYPQQPDNNYYQPTQNNYPQPSDNNYQQPDNYGQQPEYQQPTGSNYDQTQRNLQPPSDNNYEQPPDNTYQQTSERNYEPTPQANYPPYEQHSSSESTDDGLIVCHEDADCPPNAICTLLSASDNGNKHCICPEGYEGDAFECIERTTPNCNCGVSAHCVSVNNNVNEYICVCDPGYHGDGYVCRPNFSCKNNSDCEYNAECKQDQKTGEYICQCSKGFIKDQNDACIPDAQLCNGAWCAEHASCLYDADIDLNYCHCDEGYTGDAISQCVATDQTCDLAHDCSPNAICTALDDTPTCICKDGYIGDGYRCTLESTCKSDPLMCDLHASCLKIHDSYVCECNTGYNGNGTFCDLNPRQAGNFLVASDGASVYRVPIRMTSRGFATPFNSGVSQIAVGIDVDCEAGTIYWGDVVSFAIKTSRYDGSDAGLFLSDGVKSPEGISIDWSARNIFWTDSKKLTIEVANLDTKVRKVLFAVDNISNPRGIAVHPQRGKIFWSDWKRSNPKIEWANMDGTQRGIFLDKNDVALPNSLAIDWQRDRLCFADAGLFNIKCVGIDTLEEETIAANCSYPFGLAIYGNKFFWTDWKTLKIEYVDIETQERGQMPIATASRRLYGVAVAPEECPQVHSVCMFRNGGCNFDQLCLPNGSTGRTCVNADNTFNVHRKRRFLG